MDDAAAVKSLVGPEDNRDSCSFDGLALHESIKAGLSTRALDVIKNQLDLTDEQLGALLGCHASTLSNRRQSGSLTADESDRLVRIARVVGTARTVLGTDGAAWLNREQYALGGRIPRELLSTEAGCRLVENTLRRIEHSICL